MRVEYAYTVQYMRTYGRSARHYSSCRGRIQSVSETPDPDIYRALQTLPLCVWPHRPPSTLKPVSCIKTIHPYLMTICCGDRHTPRGAAGRPRPTQFPIIPIQKSGFRRASAQKGSMEGLLVRGGRTCQFLHASAWLCSQ